MRARLLSNARRGAAAAPRPSTIGRRRPAGGGGHVRTTTTVRRACRVAAGGVLAVVATPIAAHAGTYGHYGPPSAGPWSLAGKSVAASSGTLPVDFPGPRPWDMPAGDYCSAYKFSQPGAATTSAPLASASGVNLGPLTGFDPGTPRTAHQLRHNPQAHSSACQAKGATWGFWTNAATSNNYCFTWCGVRHDYSTGRAIGTRPWSDGYPRSAKLVMSAFRQVQSFRGYAGWSYICAMLHDTASAQRLEYCLRVWRSWTGPAGDPPIVLLNPRIGLPGTGFVSIVTDITAAGTRYAQNWGGATTVQSTVPSGNTYSAAITREHLVNAVSDANARIRAGNLGTCLGLLTLVRCYSTNPDKYALLGIQDGLELQGSGDAHFGGHSTGLRVATDY